MTLKVTRAERGESVERRVLWALLTERRVLAAVAPHYRPAMFGGREMSLLAGLAVEFFRRAGRPPGRDILAQFDAWATGPAADPEQAGLVGRLLQDLFDRYEGAAGLSPDVLADEARELYARNVALEWAGRVQAEFEAGNPARGLELFRERPALELAGPAAAGLFGPDANWDAMAEARVGPLIRFPEESALQNFFADVLRPSGFVSFLGKEKVGKSWWLQWLAWEAMEQGLNVLYLEAGDSTEGEVRERLAARLVGRPLAAGRYFLPAALDVNKRAFTVTAREVRHAADVTDDEVRIAGRRRHRAWGGDRMHLACVPSGTMSASGVEALIQDLADRLEWHPQVVVIDYADLLAPENPRAEKRDQIDDTWRALRTLSQRRHALVVTATQARRDAYVDWVLTREHVAEDKRKLAHVTAMLGINQTDGEKNRGVYRLNVVAGRRLKFGEETCLWCAGNLGYSHPAMLCTF